MSALSFTRSREETPPAPQGEIPQAANVREAILDHGLEPDRAIALADALDREGRLLEALEACVIANRMRRDGALERRIVELRLRAFDRLDRSVPPPWPPETPDDPPGSGGGPPEVDASDASAARVRNGVLRHGSILIRGLVPRARVARLRDNMDRAFAAYDAADAGRPLPDGATWYAPLENIRNPVIARKWRRQAGAVLAAESPRAFFDLLETIHDVGLDTLVAGYFGERPALAAEKVTMFRIHADDWRVRETSWHQDGAFLGGAGIRTLNVWFALSRCGRDAPGMAIMPVPLERILPVGEEGAHYDWSLSPHTVQREMAGVPVWRPECDEGDVLVFDHLTLHRTAADLGMPNWRYAFETWFFSPSAYPREFSTPLVV
jgi:hypothetical protein